MEGNFDGSSVRPPEGQKQQREVVEENLAQYMKKYEGSKAALEEKNPGIILKVEQYMDFIKRDATSLTAEEKEKMDELQGELRQAGEADTNIKEFVEYGEKKALFEYDAEKSAKEASEDEKDEDLTPKEADVLEEKIKSVVETQQELANKPGITLEDAARLRTEIKGVGEDALMKKIKRSRGIVAKSMYGLWVTFLISTAFFFLATKYVAKPFEGKH